MKKQHFYIFYSENEKSAETEDVQFKLVKSYMNSFCINEDNQAEVIEVHQLKEIRNFFKMRFSNNNDELACREYKLYFIIMIYYFEELPKQFWKGISTKYRISTAEASKRRFIHETVRTFRDKHFIFCCQTIFPVK